MPIKQGIAKNVLKWEKKSGKGDYVVLALLSLPSQKSARIMESCCNDVDIDMDKIHASTINKLWANKKHRIGKELPDTTLDCNSVSTKTSPTKNNVSLPLKHDEMVSQEEIDVREFDNTTLSSQQKLLL